MGIGHWELGIFAIAFSYTIFCVSLFAIYVNTIAFFTMMLYSQHPSRGDAIARTRKNCFDSIRFSNTYHRFKQPLQIKWSKFIIKTSREFGNPVALALGGKTTRDALASCQYFVLQLDELLTQLNANNICKMQSDSPYRVASRN
ncbi:MAG: hypothetical protein HC785_08945 [Calothrix sp. CSU_2_0]|nr:hypothetical protein [Calothrix sp. CSU_2_0]